MHTNEIVYHVSKAVVHEYQRRREANEPIWKPEDEYKLVTAILDQIWIDQTGKFNSENDLTPLAVYSFAYRMAGLQFKDVVAK